MVWAQAHTHLHTEYMEDTTMREWVCGLSMHSSHPQYTHWSAVSSPGPHPFHAARYITAAFRVNARKQQLQ